MVGRNPSSEDAARSVPEKYALTSLAETSGKIGAEGRHPFVSLLKARHLADVSRPSLFEIAPAQAGRVGARLLLFWHVWVASISDFWVIRTVSSGHRWAFSSTPPHRFVSTLLPHSEEQRQVLLSYVDLLKTQGAVVLIPKDEWFQGIYSPLFLVQKKSGSWRPVIDLTYLNKFIEHGKFKMETQSTIQRAIQPADWMISMDLKDAYFHVPVEKEFHKYLQFQVRQDHLQFICLPFGLTTSPLVFSKVLLATVALIRLKGVRLYHYPDDLLILSQNREQLLAHREQVISTLSSFGWLLNLGKSHLDPAQRLIYLGAQFDTVENTISLPLQKIQSVRDRISRALHAPRLKASQCLEIVGTMVFMTPMVKWALWRLRPFQSGFLQQWKTGDKNQVIHITSTMKNSLFWWLQRKNLLTCHSISPISWVTVTTDASCTGWGALCGSNLAQGKWDTCLPDPGSNVLELRAAWYALQSFSHVLKWVSVLLRMDNTTVVTYVKRQGGTRSSTLLREVEPILLWAQKNLSNISAVFVPGVQNTQADFLSRTELDNKWSLHVQTFKWILSLGIDPEVDLFACLCNFKLKTFYTRGRCSQAFRTDALMDQWRFRRAYAFPTLPVILRFLQRL